MEFSWRRFFRPTKEKLFWGGTCFILAGIAILVIKLTDPKVKSKQDLFFFTGFFKEYSWKKEGRGSHLKFSLQNYNNSFQIVADFFSALKKDKFKALTYGDSVTIAIPIVYKKYLNSGKELSVFSISNRQIMYLDYNDTVRKYNSLLWKIASIFFILSGLTFLIYRISAFRKRKPHTPPP